MAWAFIGGLCLDFFALRPLGSTVFEMLGVVAMATLAQPLLSRSRYPGCVAAVLVLTPVFLVISDVVTGLLRPPAPPLSLSDLVVAGVTNAAVAAIVAPVIIGFKRRSEQQERVVWWR
jgi:cell shape-determining protein MreD